MNGLEGAPINWNGIKVLPGLGGTYGNEALPLHARRFFDGDPRGGLILTLMDVWVLDARMCSQFDVASWCPVDHDPAPPAVVQFFRESGAVPIAMSRFGQEMLAAVGLDPLYMPHGVDTSIYSPVDKLTARARIGGEPDEFVVGMVAANKGHPSRKSFVAALEAFAVFRQEHENARLCLHTDVAGVWSQGVQLGPVIQSLGIPEDAINIVDPYAVHFHPFAAETMALLYSSFDVLLSPSTGEGFGVPILEAAACGTPSIVTDFSAMPEVAGPAGWRVPGSRVWTGQQSWQRVPHVSAIVDALEDCYTMPPAGRLALSDTARSHALGYDVERVLTDHMLPALEAAQARCGAAVEPLELELQDVA